MNKQNIIFSMVLLIVSYDNLQASVSIDSDTIQHMYKDGMNLLARESMDRFVTPSVIQDPTSRQRGLAKIVTGSVICLGGSQVHQKNKATNVACATGGFLVVSGLLDIIFQYPITNFTESVTQLAVTNVAAPLVVNALEHNGYSKSASGVFVYGTTALVSTIVSSQHESSKSTPTTRMCSDIRKYSLSSIGIEGLKYLSKATE